jgi:hypothetical protein
MLAVAGRRLQVMWVRQERTWIKLAVVLVQNQLMLMPLFVAHNQPD